MASPPVLMVERNQAHVKCFNLSRIPTFLHSCSCSFCNAVPLGEGASVSVADGAIVISISTAIIEACTIRCSGFLYRRCMPKICVCVSTTTKRVCEFRLGNGGGENSLLGDNSLESQFRYLEVSLLMHSQYGYWGLHIVLQ
jgi:hypothetical protein